MKQERQRDVNGKPDETTDRREFVRAAGRWAALGLLGGGVAVLLARNGGECLRPESCRGCGEFVGCELPRAIAARAEKARDERNG
jgi:hypothetical protein